MTDTLHTIGYYFAALIVATTPAAMFYWFLIHPFVGLWRQLGKVISYVLITIFSLGLAAFIWSFKESLLTIHWG